MINSTAQKLLLCSSSECPVFGVDLIQFRFLVFVAKSTDRGECLKRHNEVFLFSSDIVPYPSEKEEDPNWLKLLCGDSTKKAIAKELLTYRAEDPLQAFFIPGLLVNNSP